MLGIDDYIMIAVSMLIGALGVSPIWLLIYVSLFRRAKRTDVQPTNTDWRKEISDTFDDSEDVQPIWRAVKMSRPQWRVVEPPIIVDCEIVE